MVTNPNDPAIPVLMTQQDTHVKTGLQTGSYTAWEIGLTKRETIAIQLAASMWSNPAILDLFTSRGMLSDRIGASIAEESVKGADRLIAALNEPLEPTNQQEQPEEENEDDKPSDYPEENN